MKFSTKAATFLSSIKTQTYDKKESEMIITYQQKRVFHLSLLMLALCAPIYIYSVPFPNEQFYYINSVLFLFIIMCTLAYFKKRVNLTTTFSIILIAIHIEIFIEIIYCSICSGYEYSYQRALIMSNITISLLFTMLSICAYMSNISILLSYEKGTPCAPEQAGAVPNFLPVPLRADRHEGVFHGRVACPVCKLLPNGGGADLSICAPTIPAAHSVHGISHKRIRFDSRHLLRLLPPSRIRGGGIGAVIHLADIVFTLKRHLIACLVRVVCASRLNKRWPFVRARVPTASITA